MIRTTRVLLDCRCACACLLNGQDKKTFSQVTRAGKFSRLFQLNGIGLNGASLAERLTHPERQRFGRAFIHRKKPDLKAGTGLMALSSIAMRNGYELLTAGRQRDVIEETGAIARRLISAERR